MKETNLEIYSQDFMSWFWDKSPKRQITSHENYLKKGNQFAHELFDKPFDECNSIQQHYIIRYCIVKGNCRLHSIKALKIKLHNRDKPMAIKNER